MQHTHAVKLKATEDFAECTGKHANARFRVEEVDASFLNLYKEKFDTIAENYFWLIFISRRSQYKFVCIFKKKKIERTIKQYWRVIFELEFRSLTKLVRSRSRT